MLPYLMVLYQIPISSDDASAANSVIDTPQIAAAADSSGRQGRLMSPLARITLERYAESVAIETVSLDGWKSQRVGHLKLGYDLSCHKGERRLHIEVKGTTTRGEEVILTPHEVRHVYDQQCDAEHALFVLSDVQIDSPSDHPICSGGRSTVLIPWQLEQRRLIPTEYSYRLI
jgi:hypothetical protein